MVSCVCKRNNVQSASKGCYKDWENCTVMCLSKCLAKRQSKEKSHENTKNDDDSKSFGGMNINLVVPGNFNHGSLTPSPITLFLPEFCSIPATLDFLHLYERDRHARVSVPGHLGVPSSQNALLRIRELVLPKCYLLIEPPTITPYLKK